MLYNVAIYWKTGSLGWNPWRHPRPQRHDSKVRVICVLGAPGSSQAVGTASSGFNPRSLSLYPLPPRILLRFSKILHICSFALSVTESASWEDSIWLPILQQLSFRKSISKYSWLTSDTQVCMSSRSKVLEQSERSSVDWPNFEAMAGPISDGVRSFSQLVFQTVAQTTACSVNQ